MAMPGVHACIYLAAVADVKEVFKDPSYAETVNTRGTICVLEAARRCEVKRVIDGSTTWVYSLYQLDYTVLRFGIPYGPRARDGGVIPIFVRKALRGEPLSLAGDRMQFRQFVYVEDLAEGVVLNLKPVATNRIHNLDGDDCITINQIVQTLREILGDVQVFTTPARPGDFSGKRVSSARAARELGWKPATPFHEGLQRDIHWYRSREEQ